MNEPNCSAFWYQRHRCFEGGGNLIIKAMHQSLALPRRQGNRSIFALLKKEAKNLDF
ncbi:hypothetical protein [Holospora undulata]|uniref:hypothetical protein n=1 Tax=Holospora undulata TaxID=1169117 RepID=UPI00039FF522|nr:hypothetical protein [Holospora undulata]